jgi:alkylated DNA repair protein (DNA oxidative demethylase)
MTRDLFAGDECEQALADGALWLRGFALGAEAQLIADAREVMTRAPLRHMHTPGGQRIGVAMTNCGALGWISDRRGYRYAALDPQTLAPWPELPASFRRLAEAAAARAGYAGFAPDACLVNRYEPGTRLSLHQDRDERDFAAPIVSVSLGLPATFLFGGTRRADPVQRVPLAHGDVVVWGGPSRLRFHGVLALAPGCHPQIGAARLNLTLRRAG